MEGQRMGGMKEEILNGSVIKTLFKLGWPIMLSNAFQTAYNLVDTYWLGRLGKLAVAAISPSWPIIFLFMSLAIGLAVAGVSLGSQHTGAGEMKKRNISAGQVLIFMLFASIVIAIFGFLFSGNLLHLMGVPSKVLPKSKSFLKTIFMGIPFMFIFFTFRALLRGFGDTKTPMLLTVSSVLINAILDPLFIFGWLGFPRLEVQGAAIATVIARSIASITAIFLLFSGKLGVKLKLGYLVPKLKWAKKIISIGAPTSLSKVGTALGFVILMSFVSRAGTIPMNVYGIGSRITRMINVITWGLTAALATMIGQNLGADQKERAHVILKRSTISLLVITFVGAIVVFLFRHSLYGFFISNKDVIMGGGTFLGIFSFSIPFFGLFRIAGAVFRGSGHTKNTLLLSIIRLWGVRIIASYLLYFVVGIGVVGIWIGIALGNFLGGAFSLFWLSVVNWDEKVI